MMEHTFSLRGSGSFADESHAGKAAARSRIHEAGHGCDMAGRVSPCGRFSKKGMDGDRLLREKCGVNARLESVKDWVATGAALTASFGVMTVFEGVQRVALARGGISAQQRAASDLGHWMNRVTSWATGAAFRQEGVEHLVPGQNYIIVSNHQSLFDITMASDFLREWQPRYISKKELESNIPGVSFNLRTGGSALIERKNPEQAHRVISDLGKRIARDHLTVVIYIEGTRSKTGQMGKFKPGGLRTLLREARGVPVVPVTVSGGSELLKNAMRPLTRNVQLSFKVHPPVAPPDPENEEAFLAFVDELQKTIEGALPAQASSR